MSTACDVAAYILATKGEMTAMKLQKLVYYSQAWSLVWDDRPLFADRIEAWANGPVCRSLYEQHRGTFTVSAGMISGNPDGIDSLGKETIDQVVAFYGDKSGQWLSELTHSERPWLEARHGIADGARGSAEITLASMAEYYASL